VRLFSGKKSILQGSFSNSDPYYWALLRKENDDVEHFFSKSDPYCWALLWKTCILRLF